MSGTSKQANERSSTVNKRLTWALAVLVGLFIHGSAFGGPISGDLRYRHETIDKEGSDARNRHRIRARFGIKGEVNDHLTLVGRLASGSSDPVSTNQTLDGSFASKGLVLDRAYFAWHTETAGGARFNVLGGKIKNPYFIPGKSQILWDGDLNPEGLAVQWTSRPDAPASVFVNAGGFWVDERSSDDDSMLLGAQAGVRTKVLTAGAGMFAYSETKGRSPFFDAGDSFGNSTVAVDPDGIPDSGDETQVYAQDFREFEVFFELSIPAAPLPVTLSGDLVRNTAPDEDNTAYLVGLAVGKAKKPGQWQAGYNYRKVEKDAVLGVFCDSDFIGGGTDGSGHVFSFKVAVGGNAALGATYFHNKAGLDSEMDYKRLQVDFVSKFR
jgi:hypothetical protein